MKRILTSIAIIAFSITSFSQEELELHYKLKAKATEKIFKKTAKEMNGGTMDFYMTSSLFRMDIGFGKEVLTTTLIDMEQDSMIMLISAEGLGDMAYGGKFQEMQAKDAESATPTTEVKTEETETINGYECVKTVVTEGGKTTEMWCTSSIKNPNENKGVVEGSNSIPVKFSVKEGGLILTYTLKKHSYKVDKTLLKMEIPSKYSIKNMSN